MHTQRLTTKQMLVNEELPPIAPAGTQLTRRWCAHYGSKRVCAGCVRGRYAEDSAANSASRRMRAGRCFSGQEGTRDEKPLKQCWLELWALPFDLASRQDLPISSSAHRCLSISAAPSRSGSPNLNLAAAPPADHE